MIFIKKFVGIELEQGFSYMENDFTQLLKKTAYDFKDISLLETALSHRSCGKVNNERLEFLGDSLLNFIIAHELFKQFPPYKVTAMEQQIVQSTEAIERADNVIAQEYSSIAELREVLALCKLRDTTLRSLGATIAVG